MTSSWNRSIQKKAKQLHGHSWRIEIDETIEENSPDANWFEYINGSFAKFRCSGCRRSWGSTRVQVVFHFQLNKERKQGNIKLRGFKQECKTCDDPHWEQPVFPDENIDVMVEKLVKNIRKKCYRENVGNANRGFFRRKMDGPHETSHCEACRLGICSQG